MASCGISALILYKNNIQQEMQKLSSSGCSTALILYKNNIQRNVEEKVTAIYSSVNPL